MFFVSFSGNAFSQIVILGDLVHEKESARGTEYSGTITFKNNYSMPKSIKVFQREYWRICGKQSQKEIEELGRNPRTNANWITFSPSNLTIPPNGISRVNYKVDVPIDSALHGSYFSTIIIEEIAGEEQSGIEAGAPTITPKRVESKKTVITTISKINYVFLIVTHIENTGSVLFNVTNTKLFRSNDNHRILGFDLENNGERLMRPSVWVELFDASSGLKISNNNKEKYFGLLKNIPPGGCANQEIDLGIIPVGNYKAVIMVDAGGDNIWGTQYNFKFDK